MKPERKKVQVVIMAIPPPKNVLLLQTNQQRGCFWQNITGNVEAGESFAQAALREIEEETKFHHLKTLSPLDLTLEFYHPRYNITCIEKCFLALLPSLATPQLDPSEHLNFKWIPLNEITPQHYHYDSNFKAYEKSLEALDTTLL